VISCSKGQATEHGQQIKTKPCCRGRGSALLQISAQAATKYEEFDHDGKVKETRLICSSEDLHAGRRVWQKGRSTAHKQTQAQTNNQNDPSRLCALVIEGIWRSLPFLGPGPNLMIKYKSHSAHVSQRACARAPPSGQMFSAIWSQHLSG
jgi:hypothetical protein